jgi:hypothetical protein
MPKKIVNPSAIRPPASNSHVVHAIGLASRFVAGQAALDRELLIEIEPVVSLT